MTIVGHLTPGVHFYLLQGGSCDSLWGPFYDFSATLDAKMGDSLQVHVMSDPGKEMIVIVIGDRSDS